MVDDDETEPFYEKTLTGLKCDRRIRQQKFMVDYDVENCAGSVAPGRRNSKGEITVTATTEDGELVATRILKCNK
jgi:hypothetical protein